jgi:serine/threonine protein kinase
VFGAPKFWIERSPGGVSCCIIKQILMTVSAGTRFGPYEILAPLGAGGMGEVYKARDTKLDRLAALKVLPAAFAQDPDRLTRFEREAKVLASLNHPNIA